MKKKILAITGIRSEYDILFPVLMAIKQNSNFSLKIVASGAHLSDWHGRTLSSIEKDGFVIADKIDSLLQTDRLTQRAKGVGLLTLALSQTIEREQPDYLLVVGDREESIATAITGNYMDVLVIHLGGGDTVYGNADDPIRFAVSKLSHLHFVFTKRYADNLIQIGENKNRVFCVGDPGLDNINSVEKMSFSRINRFLKWEIKPHKYFVIINHPLSSEKEETFQQMKTIIKSCEAFCKDSHIKAVGIYPNTDPGSSAIVHAINDRKELDNIRFFKTLPRAIFVNIMRNSLALIGNSSMGFLEAPFYELPAINVGNRQKGRINAGNVNFVSYNQMEIYRALENACFNNEYRKRMKHFKYFYGDGHTAEKIVKVLLHINPLDQKWHIKKDLC